MRSKTIRLPTSVYSEQVLLRAIADYRSICRVDVRTTTDTHICRIFKSVVDVNLTAHEFMNYLVEVACSGRRE